MRGCSARHARRPTSASIRKRTSGGSSGSAGLTQNLGVNLAGIRILFELEERMGTRILEALFEATDEDPDPAKVEAPAAGSQPPISTRPTR